MARSTALRLQLYADYRQIHVFDEQGQGDLGDAWTVKATEDRIAAAGDIVGIGTEADDHVDVEVTTHASRPAETLAGIDHATEATLQVASGRIGFAGCTEMRADAARVDVAPGTWGLRALHDRIGKKRERIRLLLYPVASAAEPSVLKRWDPSAARPRKKGPSLSEAQAAAALARSGRTAAALETLLRLAAAGDAAAAASAAEILAYQGRWAEVVPHATALLANPAAVNAGNVFTDMTRLLRRAAHELADPGVIARAAAVVPPAFTPRAEATLLRELIQPVPPPAQQARVLFDAAEQEARSGKRFRDRPAELAVHLFAVAALIGLDDETIARWDPTSPMLLFDQAVRVARAHARRGDEGRAWDVLRAKIVHWYAVDRAQVAPIEPLVDPLLRPIMTPERCAFVLATPRSGETGDS